jgi:hypothetical protein
MALNEKMHIVILKLMLFSLHYRKNNGQISRENTKMGTQIKFRVRVIGWYGKQKTLILLRQPPVYERAKIGRIKRVIEMKEELESFVFRTNL